MRERDPWREKAEGESSEMRERPDERDPWRERDPQPKRDPRWESHNRRETHARERKREREKTERQSNPTMKSRAWRWQRTGCNWTRCLVWNAWVRVMRAWDEMRVQCVCLFKQCPFILQIKRTVRDLLWCLLWAEYRCCCLNLERYHMHFNLFDFKFQQIVFTVTFLPFYLLQ